MKPAFLSEKPVSYTHLMVTSRQHAVIGYHPDTATPGARLAAAPYTTGPLDLLFYFHKLHLSLKNVYEIVYDDK